jgi:hypothetical protein
MPGKSSARKTLRTAVWNVATGLKRPLRAVSTSGLLVLVIAALSIAAAAVSKAAPPLPPLPPFASAPPIGVILEESAVNEPGIEVSADEEKASQVLDQMPASASPEAGAAEDIQLVTADLFLMQSDANGKANPEAQSREQRDEEKARLEQKDNDAAAKSCGDQAKACQEALKTLRDDGIETIALDIRVGGRPGSDYPCECRLEGETFEPRRFATTMMTWKAAGNCHKPLYFEDWNLERYGHSHGPLDPVISAAHFFVTLPVLPYKMGVELPWECVYPLGYYRPGNCAPWTVPAVPISCRGFAVEAATVTGLVFLLP